MAKGFDTNWLDELKYKNDIVEVISRYIPLQKKGSKYFGCCPFHHEKTASFCVNSGEQFYHCFGCGVSGDVIKFIREMESVDFMDACKILADRVGMILPDFQGDAEYQKNKDEKTRLTTLMREAARYYYSVLTHKERGQKAREYLFSRGINEEFMKQYGFGLSDSDRGVVLYLNQKGYTENEMRDCGLIEGERNPIDAFRGRIIVPIFNSMGKVVAFGGRIYNGEAARAKYKNSTNTKIFDKGRTIYGANFVKAFKQKNALSDVILVEGYMDVIALGSHGIPNAVAGMGTALTEGQARELTRLSKNIYVCYDGDEAGRKATLRNIDVLIKQGAELSVVSLPDGYDPDDMMRKESVGAFQKLLAEAIPAIDYKLKVIEEANDLRSHNGKAKFMQSAVEVLNSIPDLAERAVYVDVVSKKTGIVHGEIEKQIKEIPEEKPQISVLSSALKADKVQMKAARFALNAIITNKKYAKLSDLKRDWLPDATQIEIYDYVKMKSELGEKVAAGMLYGNVSETPELDAVINNYEEISGLGLEEKYYVDCLIKLADSYYGEEIERLTKEFEDETDSGKKTELLKRISQIQTKLRSQNLEDKY